MTRISAFRFTNVIKILSVLSATLMCFIAPQSSLAEDNDLCAQGYKCDPNSNATNCYKYTTKVTTTLTYPSKYIYDGLYYTYHQYNSNNLGVGAISQEADRGGYGCYNEFIIYMPQCITKDMFNSYNNTYKNLGSVECTNGCYKSFFYVSQVNNTNKKKVFNNNDVGDLPIGIESYASCVKCPEGSEQCGGDKNGHKNTGFECKKGYYKEDYTCTPCPTGAESCTSPTVFTCQTNYYKDGLKCTQCPKNTESCDKETGFTCKDNYYKDGSKCTQCPENAASCDKETGFTCQANYYKDGSKCTQCPMGAESCTSINDYTCPDDSYDNGQGCTQCPENAESCNKETGFTCQTNYYKNGTACTECPTRDDVFTDEAKTTKAQYTSNTGATSIDDCYLPTNKTYYNKRGKFQFTNQCNWQLKN